MRYSVYNVSRGDFDYYEDGRPAESINAPKPAHLVSRTLGSTIEQAAWPLPAGARHTGSGPIAVGRVARRGGAALGDIAIGSPLVKAAMLFASAILAYKYLVKGRRR